MKKNTILYATLLVSLILAPLAIHAASKYTPSRLIMGCVQFPSSICNIPTIRFYCGGRKVPCEIDEANKRLVFNIPKSIYQKQFCILITEKIAFEVTQKKCGDTVHNTVDYLKVAKDQPYKLFVMQLSPETTDAKTHNKLPLPNDNPTMKWEIDTQAQLKDEGKIPDVAIIMCYDPSFVEGLKANNSFELPTVAIKKDIKEKALHDVADKLVVASIDYDTMHATMANNVKFEDQRTLVAPITT